MEESKSLPNLFGDNNDEGFDGGRAARPFIGVITLTAVLYLGKEVLLPVAMAAILAVILSPIASRLDRFIGRFISAALVVTAAITVVGAIGCFLTAELTRSGRGSRLLRQYRHKAHGARKEHTLMAATRRARGHERPAAT